MDDKAYASRYPRYCRKCKGLGIFKHPRYWRALVIAECRACLEARICPRCAAALPESRYTCTSCAWTPSDHNRGLPSAQKL